MTRLPFERLAACCVAGWLSLQVGGIRVASAESESALLLGYDAPRDCPTQGEVKQAAIRLAGQTHKAQVIANVQIEKDSQGYLAHVRTHEGSRQRLLRDISCTGVAEAVEVLLALAIDPDAQVELASSPSNTTAPAWTDVRPFPKPDVSSFGRTQQVPPLPPISPPAQSAAASVPSRSMTVVVSALLGLDVGTLPRVSEVASARLGVARPRWALFGAGHLWGHSKAELPDVKGVGGNFSLWTVSGTACFWIAGTLPAVDVCVGGEAGRLSGESFGVRKPGSGTSLWLAPLAGVSGTMPINSILALVLGAEVAAPLIRHPFYLQDVGTEDSRRLYRPAPFSARLNFGLSLGFW